MHVFVTVNVLLQDCKDVKYGLIRANIQLISWTLFSIGTSLWSLTWNQCVRSAMRNSHWSWKRGWRSCRRLLHGSEHTVNHQMASGIDNHFRSFLRGLIFKNFRTSVDISLANCCSVSLNFTLTCAFIQCFLAQILQSILSHACLISLIPVNNCCEFQNGLQLKLLKNY